MKVDIRPQRMSDAKRFFDILTDPEFSFLPVTVKSLDDERKWLRQSMERRRKRTEFNFSIIYGGELVGGIGIKINQQFPHVGEAGFFVDRSYWGKGIAARALGLLERFAFGELGLKRIEMLIATRNAKSEQVAKKRNYRKEGILRKRLLIRGRYHDCNIYAKVK